jgi:hypothetical protein
MALGGRQFQWCLYGWPKGDLGLASTRMTLTKLLSKILVYISKIK